MTMYGFTTISAALTVGSLSVAAAAVPTGSADVIATLESQGYDVVSVGVGPTFTHTESLSGAEEYTDHRQYVPVDEQTVYVNVRCPCQFVDDRPPRCRARNRSSVL